MSFPDIFNVNGSCVTLSLTFNYPPAIIPSDGQRVMAKQQVATRLHYWVFDPKEKGRTKRQLVSRNHFHRRHNQKLSERDKCWKTSKTGCTDWYCQGPQLPAHFRWVIISLGYELEKNMNINESTVRVNGDHAVNIKHFKQRKVLVQLLHHHRRYFGAFISTWCSPVSCKRALTVFVCFLINLTLN